MPIKHKLTRSDINSDIFPPISSLFSDSWYLFTSRINRFFLFTVINFCIMLVFYLGFFTLVATVMRPILNPLLQPHPSVTAIQLLPALLPATVVLLLILIIGLIIIGSINITWLLLSIKEDESVPFKSILSASPAYLMPVLSTGLLLTVLNLGVFILVVLPSLVSGVIFFLSIFFVFAFSELIFLGRSNLSAIKRSYTVGVTNFKPIALRLGSILLAYIALILVFNAIQIVQSPVVNWISAIAEILFSWYSICYIYLLYQQASEVTDENKTVSKWWMWGTALIGWVVTLLLIVLIAYGISYSIKSGILQKTIDQIAQQAMPINQNKIKTSAVKSSITPIAKPTK